MNIFSSHLLLKSGINQETVLYIPEEEESIPPEAPETARGASWVPALPPAPSPSKGLEAPFLQNRKCSPQVTGANLCPQTEGVRARMPAGLPCDPGRSCILPPPLPPPPTVAPLTTEAKWTLIRLLAPSRGRRGVGCETP